MVVAAILAITLDPALRLLITKVKTLRFHRKGPDSVEVPIPIHGPDLIDPRRNQEIKAVAAAKLVQEG